MEEEIVRLLGITGGVWAVPGVGQQPVIELESWQVFELESGERHLVGWNVTGEEGRVSSAIVSFDAVGRRVLTRSARVYQLVGPYGSNSDALYVWGEWLQARGAKAVDVTEDVVRQIEAAAQ